MVLWGAVGAVGAGGPPGALLAPIDTVAILQSALESHFPDGRPDSVALDVRPRSGSGVGLSESILERLADRVGMPVARRSEVHACDGERRPRRRCHLDGLTHLLSVRLVSLEEARAVVDISALHEWKPGRVDVEGSRYALEPRDGRWVVIERMMSWAS